MAALRSAIYFRRLEQPKGLPAITPPTLGADEMAPAMMNSNGALGRETNRHWRNRKEINKKNNDFIYFFRYKNIYIYMTRPRPARPSDRPNGRRRRRSRGPRGSSAHKIWVPLRAQTQVRGRSINTHFHLFTQPMWDNYPHSHLHSHSQQVVGTYFLSLPSGVILELRNYYYVLVLSKNIILISSLGDMGFSFIIEKIVVL